MATAAELRQLLSLLHFGTRMNCMEGLTAFRNLLEQDSDGRTASANCHRTPCAGRLMRGNRSDVTLLRNGVVGPTGQSPSPILCL